MNIVAVLVTITCVIIQRSWQQDNRRICRTLNRRSQCQNVCELLDRRSSLGPRITNEPTSVTTIVDQESSVTFACEAEWIRSLQIPDRICEFISLDFESPENLTGQLGLSLEWEIDGSGPFNSTEALTPTLIQRGITISTTCSFNVDQLFYILEPGSVSFCEDNFSPDVVPHCRSIINITRQGANSNVQLRCSVQPSHEDCADGEYKRTSRSVNLQLQGLLGPPPGLRVHELNSTTLYLSWNAPSTLRGIPISNYSMDIDNLVTVSTVTVFASVNQPSIDPNMTSLDLSQVGSIGYLYNPSCESLRFSVRAWNTVGEGASSIVLYTQESLLSIKTYTPVHSPGTLCILCEFNATTEAQGCEASIMEVMPNQTSTTTREVLSLTVMRNGGQGSMVEAFDCISGLQTGNNTVQIREIECSGGIGLREFIHHQIRVQGLNRQTEVSTNTVIVTSIVAPGEAAQEIRTNTQAIGFSVAIGILSVIGVLLLVILIAVVTLTRKKNNNQDSEVILKGHEGTIASQPISQQLDHSHEQELLYDNDYVRPRTDTDPPVPAAEYSYTAVARSRQLKPKANSENNDNGIEMNSCVAYGTTA